MALLGARLAMAGGKPTAKNYIQDGLYGLWDGIENVAYGKHDSSATRWVDLTGKNVSLDTNGTGLLKWDDNSILPNGNNSYICCYGDSSRGSNLGYYFDGYRSFTIEIVMDTVNKGNTCVIFTNGQNGWNYGTGIWRRSDAIYGSTMNTVSASSIKSAPDKAYYAMSYLNNDHYNINVNGVTSDDITSIMRDTARSCFQIGTWFYNYDSGSPHYRHLYAFRVYSRQLSAAEMAANYAVDKVRFGL